MLRNYSQCPFGTTATPKMQRPCAAEVQIKNGCPPTRAGIRKAGYHSSQAPAAAQQASGGNSYQC
jgi:hypothetical protein